MKPIFNYIFILIFHFSISGFSQSHKIDKIEISDTILSKTISDFIFKKKKSYPEFEEKGYIEVELRYFNDKAINNELHFEYKIKDQYYRKRMTTSPKLFPIFYCYINRKLILFYDGALANYFEYDFTKKSKRKLIKKMKPFLGKPHHIIAKDENGNIIVNDKNFVDESFNIHGGITLSIYRNGRIKIE